jgi:acylphosphatase
MRRRLIITGRVQGVFYRGWFTEQMRRLGIRGWVRNRADSSVEAVIEGPDEMVSAAIARAWEGSPASRVAAVTVHEDAPSDTPDIFEQRTTV